MLLLEILLWAVPLSLELQMLVLSIKAQEKKERGFVRAFAL